MQNPCPQAEKLNGRAAMVGYALAWVVDSLSGVGLVDQQNSFLGKLLLHVAVFGILLFRSGPPIPSPPESQTLRCNFALHCYPVTQF